MASRPDCATVAEGAIDAGGGALRRLFAPVSLTLAVQTLVALAVYSAPVMAPAAAERDFGVPAAWVGYYIAIVYLGSMPGSLADPRARHAAVAAGDHVLGEADGRAAGRGDRGRAGAHADPPFRLALG